MKIQICLMIVLASLLITKKSCAQNLDARIPTNESLKFNITETPPSSVLLVSPKNLARIIIGTSASIIVNVIPLPQIYTILTSKNSKDLSLISQSVGLLGFVFWISYGALDPDYIIIASSGVGSVFQVVLMILTWRYKRPPSAQILPIEIVVTV